MELYGGGMVGNRTNYQLGGRVAASRRNREYAGEIRRLNEAAERAARRQKRASSLGNILGTIGGIAGSLIPIPGVGTAVGTALGSAIGGGLGRLAGESTYQGTKVEGGKYARDSRRNLQGSIDDFKSSMGERALSQGLRSGLGSFISAGGIGETKDFLARKYGIDPGGRFASKVTQQGMADNPFLAIEDANIDMSVAAEEGVLQDLTDDQLRDFLPSNYDPLPTPVRPNVPIEPETVNMLSNQMMETIDSQDFSQLLGPELPELLSRPTTDSGFDTDFYNFKGGGMVNMMPQYQNGGFVKEAEKERFDAMNIPTSFADPTDEMRQSSMNLPNTTFSPSAPPAPFVPSYGTATDVMGALGQLGMTDVALDPRLQEFMGDLPDFQMGYAQQVGDIYSGARQAARGMRGQQMQAAGQRGFAGSGIGQTQSQQAFGDLRSDVARQRRGVVEGFQADLLSAIGDIERKGEFEFGTSPEALGARAQNVLSSFKNTLAQQGITVPSQPAAPTAPEEQEMQDYFDSIYG